MTLPSRPIRALLITAPIAGLLIGIAINVFAPGRYQADVNVRVGMAGVLPTFNIAAIEPPAALAERIKSPAFQQQIGERLKRPLSLGLLALGDQLRARPLPGTQFVELRGSSADGEVARAIVTQAAALAREQHEREAEPSLQTYRGILESRRSEIRAMQEELASMGAPVALGSEFSRGPRADSLFVSSLIATTRKRLSELESETQIVKAIVELPKTHPTQAIGEVIMTEGPWSRSGWLAPLAGLLAGLVLSVAVAVARAPRAR
jgi:hypothetical protein